MRSTRRLSLAKSIAFNRVLHVMCISTWGDDDGTTDGREVFPSRERAVAQLSSSKPVNAPASNRNSPLSVSSD